ncbi:MAG: hypothetical protein RBT55_14660, partial [Rhodocyclaceae bacterium]|nr:hypothetical protein [Rhodocyclaceae bacterium]
MQRFNQSVINPAEFVAALLIAGSVTHASATDIAETTQHDYWPGRDKTIPHVSGDTNFSDTYQDWKDAAAIAA